MSLALTSVSTEPVHQTEFEVRAARTVVAISVQITKLMRLEVLCSSYWILCFHLTYRTNLFYKRTRYFAVNRTHRSASSFPASWPKIGIFTTSIVVNKNNRNVHRQTALASVKIFEEVE